MKTYDMIKKEIDDYKKVKDANFKIIIDSLSDEQIERLVLKMKNGIGAFIDKCKELEIVDAKGNINTDKCNKLFNKNNMEG